MIVLDTNVVSEVARPIPSAHVLSWLDGLDDRPAITAVTATEMLTGVLQLPAGRRRDELLRITASALDSDFRGRILPFDAEAAGHCAELIVERRAAGRPVSLADAQIAAICRARSLALATRNVRDFDGTGIEIVDPWAGAR